jgi:hypothetical protein
MQTCWSFPLSVEGLVFAAVGSVNGYASNLTTSRLSAKAANLREGSLPDFRGCSSA